MEIILFAIGVFVYSLLFLALSPKARRISLGFIVVSFIGVFLTMITDSDIARALARRQRQMCIRDRLSAWP